MIFSTVTNGVAAVSNPRMMIDHNGNVAIGGVGIIPDQKLQVDGNISLEDAGYQSAPPRTIGFSTPTIGNHAPLSIKAKSTVNNATAYIGGTLELFAGDYNQGTSTTNSQGHVVIQAGKNSFGTANTASGDIIFRTGDITTADRMLIEGYSGNVGIGTITPTAKLHVNIAAGDVTNQGLIVNIANTGASKIGIMSNIASTDAASYALEGRVSGGSKFRITGDNLMYVNTRTQFLPSNVAAVVSLPAPTTSCVNLTGTGAVTVTALSTTGAMDGQIVIFKQVGTGTTTFSDGVATLNLGAARALGQDDTLTLMYSLTTARWIEIAFTNN